MVPGPLRLQVTLASETPETLALNCAVPFSYRVDEVGVIEIDSALMVTVAEAFSELTALLVAVIVAVEPEAAFEAAV